VTLDEGDALVVPPHWAVEARVDRKSSLVKIELLP
jgi:hypothetical protein